MSAVGLTQRAGRQLGEWIPALVILVAMLGVWEGSIALFHIKQFLLPKPTTIATTFWSQRHSLWPAGWYTFKEALGGFFGGSIAGIGFATLVARFRILGTTLMPIAIAANAIPIIAFAPIFDAWFDPLSPHSKMAIAGVLCFFPVMVNTLRGYQSVRPQQIELMRAYAASDFEIFRRVRVPTALPYVFTALKVASVLAMIGAIVAEYFGGSFDALGVLIRNDAQTFEFPTAWAGIAVASILGITLYLAVAITERLVVSWTPGARGSQ
jgi:NitT/TauT family transport system permease protein